jgi:hypothetical protein
MKGFFLTIAAMTLLLSSCGSGGGDGDPGSGTKPTAAALLSPANNSECITGTSISETESKVTLDWNASENTDSYLVYVKNLITQSERQYNSNGNTSLDLNLLKGTPYSWYVISKSNSSEQTAVSPKWKFYNSGNGTQNYIPFPADVIEPPMSSTISGATVNLIWSGGDADGDITEYKVYMDSNASPSTLIGTVTTESLNGISVTANTTYYWKVITKDSAGNTSGSTVFQFKTQL